MDNRKDGNQVEESHVMDTRRFEGEDNEGHFPGSNLSKNTNKPIEELRKAEDKSEYNKLDDRGEESGNERTDV